MGWLDDRVDRARRRIRGRALRYAFAKAQDGARDVVGVMTGGAIDQLARAVERARGARASENRPKADAAAAVAESGRKRDERTRQAREDVERLKREALGRP